MNDAISYWKKKHSSILVRKRILNGVLPAVLMALAVGQIYAFTIFSERVANYIARPQAEVQFAFSLGIFFLGMGAAFFGKYVEKNIRLSAFVGIALFISGLCVTGVGVNLKSLMMVDFGYGFLLGLGTGIIYITPVKTLMLWFQDHKAIAAAIPIVSFGLGSSLCALIDKALRNSFDITRIFFVLAAIYVLPMIIGAVLIRKPAAAVRAQQKLGAKTGDRNGFTYCGLLCNGWFLRAWLFMFLNVSCGLSLIPLAKQLMGMVGYEDALITLVIAGCGLMNGGGRLVFAWWSDRLARRINILLILLAISLGVILLSFWPMAIGITLLVINACYGAGFSTIPAVLADHYGMDNISKIYGAVLSAWGIAGLVGNQVSLRVEGRWGLNGIIVMLAFLYALNMLNVLMLRKNAKA